MNASSYLRLVAFRHSIFALPFALQGAWLAARGAPSAAKLGWIVACAVAARTAAMGFNRLVDRELDAANPRTRDRELPAGRLRPRDAVWLVAIAGAAFVGAAFALNRLCGALAPLVLAVLFSYSFTKRFTWLAHAALGLSLALAPLGAWLAVRGAFGRGLSEPLLLSAAVLTWVAGFDVIYACQDREFDLRAGLHSIPARFGLARALAIARGLHALTILLLAFVWLRADLSWVYALAILATGLLLAWEHSLVSARDLSRIDQAFFTANGWVGVVLFAALALDPGLASG